MGLYLQEQRTLSALDTCCHDCHMMGASLTCSHVPTPVSQDGNMHLSLLDLAETQNFKIKIPKALKRENLTISQKSKVGGNLSASAKGNRKDIKR